MKASSVIAQTINRVRALGALSLGALSLGALSLGALAVAATAGGCSADDAMRRAAGQSEAARLAVRSLSEDAGRGTDLVRRTLLAIEAVKRAPFPETIAALWSAVDELPARTVFVNHELGDAVRLEGFAVSPHCDGAAALVSSPTLPENQLGLWIWRDGSDPRVVLLDKPMAAKTTLVRMSPTGSRVLAQVGCDALSVDVESGDIIARWPLRDSCAPYSKLVIRSGAADFASVGTATAGRANAAVVWSTDGCTFEEYALDTGERLAHWVRADGCAALTDTALDPVDGWVASVLPRESDAADRRLVVWRGDHASEILIDTRVPGHARPVFRGRHLIMAGAEYGDEATGDLRALVFDLGNGELVLDEVAPDWLNPEWMVDSAAKRVLYRTYSSDNNMFQTSAEASFMDGEVYARELGRGFDVFLDMGFVGGDGPAYVVKASGTFLTLDDPTSVRSEGSFWRARMELPQGTAAWRRNQRDTCFAAWGDGQVALVDARPSRWAITQFPPSDSDDVRGVLVGRSQQGRWKAVWRPSHGLDVLEGATESPPNWPPFPSETMLAVDFHPKEEWIVAGFNDGSVRRWRGRDGDPWEPVVLPPEAGEEGRDWPFSVLPNGNLLVGAEEELQELAGETLDVERRFELVRTPRELAVSADGKAVAIAYDDGRIELRTWPRGDALARAQWPDSSIETLRMTPEGNLAFRRLSWHGRDFDQMHMELVWDPERLVELACNRLPRNFTEAEWRDAFGRSSYRRTCPQLP